MHGEEGQVHADQHQPELYLPQALVQHPACHLREPVEYAREDTEDGPAKKDIMQV